MTLDKDIANLSLTSDELLEVSNDQFPLLFDMQKLNFIQALQFIAFLWV